MELRERLQLSTRPWVGALLFVIGSMAWISVIHVVLERHYPGLDGTHEFEFLEDSVYVVLSAGLFRFFLGWGQKSLREAHERTARTSEMLSAILGGVGEGIIGLDSKGRQTFVNRAAADILGYRPEELIGKEPHPIWHHSKRDGTPYPFEECPINAVWRDGAVHRASREVFWRKDGTNVLVDYVSTPIRNGGETAGAVLSFRDISQEARLESIAEAVETMNNIGYVFSAVRHELGNPVNSVKMALSVLRKNMDRFPPESVRAYLDRSLTELGRVEDLLASLKSFSLYEDVRCQPVPVETFLKTFVAAARPDFEAKGIRLGLQAHAAGLVHADPRALRQVLMNCLANAADALQGRPDGAICFETVPMNDLVAIRIVDNGAGIPPDVLRGLFKPFLTTKPHGTGLGLVIAKKMLARMDGTIDVASEVGQGTAVAITLRREMPAS